MPTSAGHPLVRAALAGFPAQPEHEAWANNAAEESETLLAVARRVGPGTSDADYIAALRAAHLSVLRGHRLFEERVESLRWMEASVRELEGLARTRFGPKQTTVALGYQPGLG
jgi:hypothetical protein